MSFWTAAEHEAAVRLRAEGLSCAAVGRVIGRSKNSVVGRLDRITNFIFGHDNKRIRLVDGRSLDERLPQQEAATGCRWIEGDPRITGWDFCGAPTVRVTSSYCAEHHVRVWTPEAIRTGADRRHGGHRHD